VVAKPKRSPRRWRAKKFSADILIFEAGLTTSRWKRFPTAAAAPQMKIVVVSTSPTKNDWSYFAAVPMDRVARSGTGHPGGVPAQSIAR